LIVARARGATSQGQLLRRTAASSGTGEIIFPTERITYAELNDLVDKFAAMLRDHGLGRGDKVGLFLGPSIDYLVSLFGAHRIGCCVVPISDRFRTAELRYIVRHSEVAALITTASDARHDFAGDLRSAVPEADLVLVWHGSDVDGPFRPIELTGVFDAVELESIESSIDPDDLAYLMYTSGTSASPKGCMISHQAVLCQAQSLAHSRYLLSENDTFWCPLPLFHNGGLATLTACLTSGANFVHTAAFEPGQALRMLAEYRCTHAIPAFETIWLRVIDHPDFESMDLSSLRVVLNAGTTQRLRQLQARTPGVVQVANYGCTEATGHLSMTLLDDPLEIRLTTGGHPLPGMQVRIVDPASRVALDTDEIGEICFRGPSRFTAYYEDPAATSAAIDEDGWYHSGDRGHLDAAGRVTFLGRLKDMLKVGGENVSASEVEEYLLTHPAVNIAAVVGAPDSYYDEVPAAFVELLPGHDASEQDLIDYCLGQIATYKVPRYVRVVTEWPMSGTKIQKFVLAAELAQELRERGIASAPRLTVGPTR
jgi:fatty-acyl-CoA synthase